MAWEFLTALNNYQFSRFNDTYMNAFLANYPNTYSVTQSNPSPPVSDVVSVYSDFSLSFHPDPATPSIDTIETLAENGIYKLAVKKTSAWGVSLLYYENDQIIKTEGTDWNLGTHPLTNPRYFYDFAFMVNHETQQATIVNLSYNIGFASATLSITPYNDTLNSAEWYGIITNLQAPQYTWTAWDQIAGNNGQYKCNLTTVEESILVDLDVGKISTSAVFSRISSQSSIWSIAQNMTLDSERIIAYSGVNWLTLTLSESGVTGNYDFTFKFYAPAISETVPFYTLTKNVIWSGTNPMSNVYLAFAHDDENYAALFLPILYKPDGVDQGYWWGSVSGSSDEMLYLWQWLQASGAGTPEYPYNTGSTDDGGNPTGATPGDHLPAQGVPSLGALQTGMFTVYCPTDEQLEDIADYLWSDNVITNIRKYFTNFSDNIIALYVLPFKPSNLPTKAFKVGNMESGDITAVEYLTSRFTTIDMGSVYIENVFDSYLDYAPYTKIECYLPGVGIVALDVDDIMCPTDPNTGTLTETTGSTISLKYNIDLMTGILVAFIYVNNEMRYQFSGKVGYSIPLTGENYTSMVTGFVTAAAGLVGTVATGGLSAPIAAGGVSAAISGTVNAMKPDIHRGGNLSGDASMLSYNTPYIIYHRPNKPLLANQENYTGFPSYKSGTLSEFSGLTNVIDAHIEGISCTEQERAEILALLKSGVIL